MIRAKYTVVLKTLMDDVQLRSRIDQALSTYPLYNPDQAYDLVPSREELNERLLNHYKYREIGFETIGRFLDELEITMKQIMPRYNELLKTVVTMANLPSPFDNVDVVEKFEETKTNNVTTGTETTSSATDTTTTGNTVNSSSKQVKSSTPQNQLNIDAKDINTVDYADEANWGKDSSEASGTSSSNGSTSATSDTQSNGSETTTHTYTKTGNQGVNTYAHDMLEFRTAIIDVVDQIVTDRRIGELFMLVY